MKSVKVKFQCRICGEEFEAPTKISEATSEVALATIKRRLSAGDEANFMFHDHQRSEVWGYAPVIGVRVVGA